MDKLLTKLILSALLAVLATPILGQSIGIQVAKKVDHLLVRKDAIRLYYDRGLSSSFIIELVSVPAIPGCKPTEGRVVVLKVTDFGEDPDSAAYCLVGFGAIATLQLGRVADMNSQTGLAASIEVTYSLATGTRSVRLKVTPWAASVEGDR